MTKKYHLKSPVERFWKFVNKTDSCWLWTGSTAPSGGNGYGHFWDGRKFVQSPHFAYELLKGKIPKNKQLDHLCRNRKCVNPEHLRIVSIEQNVMENTLGFGPINKAKTHCPKGHIYSKANTYVAFNGWRRCKKCHAQLERERRLEQKFIKQELGNFQFLVK